MRCPECLSPDVSIHVQDFGRCPETGYRDVTEVYVCATCGAEGEASELLREPAPVKREPARETRIGAKESAA